MIVAALNGLCGLFWLSIAQRYLGMAKLARANNVEPTPFRRIAFTYIGIGTTYTLLAVAYYFSWSRCS